MKTKDYLFEMIIDMRRGTKLYIWEDNQYYNLALQNKFNLKDYVRDIFYHILLLFFNQKILVSITTKHQLEIIYTIYMLGNPLRILEFKYNPAFNIKNLTVTQRLVDSKFKVLSDKKHDDEINSILDSLKDVSVIKDVTAEKVLSCVSNIETIVYSWDIDSRET